MNSVWRIIDANLNRAVEGLRVIEEVARFVMDNEQLTAEIKGCRHQLTQVRRHPAFDYQVLVAARDSEGDVGGSHTYSQTESERENYQDIAIANLKRVQEAARSLEEFSKIISPEIGYGFKQFRFRTYTLEKLLASAVSHWNRSGTNWGLYVITGERFSRGRSLTEVVSQAIDGGAKVIQLREKEMDTRRFIAEGHRIREITRSAGAIFIVNDRIDVALVVDADGVHVGQDDMDIEDVRKLVGPHKLIGVSTHSVEQAIRAEQAGADYIGIGPVFATQSKADAKYPEGLQQVKNIRAAVRIPCIAIGGIKADNVEDVILAGADGAAVITAVVAADDIKAATAALIRKIDAAKNRP
jgi:thiamine-phosphate pyrophosphorylase